jgi:hypothetical protein
MDAGINVRITRSSGKSWFGQVICLNRDLLDEWIVGMFPGLAGCTKDSSSCDFRESVFPRPALRAPVGESGRGLG